MIMMRQRLGRDVFDRGPVGPWGKKNLRKKGGRDGRLPLQDRREI